MNEGMDQDNSLYKVDAPQDINGEIAREFMHLPLASIYPEKQVRSTIDTRSESFQSLMASIRERGVLEPVLVAKRNGRYLLISGERRFTACRMLGKETIPARIIDQATLQQDVMTIQFMENLLREDIDPIDLGDGILSYFKLLHEDIDPDRIINTIINVQADPERVKNDLTTSLDVIANSVGKSLSSVRNILTLLKLPPEIRDAVKTGKIGVTQGYLFASQVNHPKLMEIFNEHLEKPMKTDALKKLLETTLKTGKAAAGRKPLPFKSLYSQVKVAQALIEDGRAKIGIGDLERLISDLKGLLDLAEKTKAEKTGPSATPRSTAKASKAKRNKKIGSEEKQGSISEVLEADGESPA